MFEFLLSQWHLDPVYIAENWTDEMLALMIEKFNLRKELEIRAIKGESYEDKYVSPETLARMSGGMIKVKHGN